MSIEDLAVTADRDIAGSAQPSFDAFTDNIDGGLLQPATLASQASQVVEEVAGAERAREDVKNIMTAILDPFTKVAEGIQMPGAPQDCKLYQNEAIANITLPEGADRVVLALDLAGSGRNGEASVDVWYIDSKKVSQTSPKQLNDGCIKGYKRLTTGLLLDQFLHAEMISAGFQVKDLTAELYKKGSMSAVAVEARQIVSQQIAQTDIGQITSDAKDSLLGIRKGDGIVCVARNIAALTGQPGGWKPGLQQVRNRYDSATEGKYTVGPPLGPTSINAGDAAVAAYSGSAAVKDAQWSALIASSQLTLSSKQRSQYLYVGAPPVYPVIPDTSDLTKEYLIWSTRDKPAMEGSSNGTVQTQMPRDTNVMRFYGSLRLTGPCNAKPTDGGGDIQVQQPQGVWTNDGTNVYSDTSGFSTSGYITDSAQALPPPGGKTVDQGNSQDFYNDSGQSLNTDLSGSGTAGAGVGDKGIKSGYNFSPTAGAGQPAGGWEVHFKLLSGTTSDAAGNLSNNVVGVAKMYAVLGTKGNVWYPTMKTLDTVAPDPAAVANFGLAQSDIPIVTTESIGELNFDGITVYPGMGMNDETGATQPQGRGIGITGAEITMKPMTGPSWAEGVERKITCINPIGGSIVSVDFTAGTIPYAQVPVVTFSASPVPGGTAEGMVTLAGGAAGPIGAFYLTKPGFGYTSPPTVTISPGTGPGDPSVFDFTMSGIEAVGNQFGIQMKGVGADMITYDGDLEAKRRVVTIVDGLTGPGVAGATSNLSVHFAQYMSGRLKSVQAPITLPPSSEAVADNLGLNNMLVEAAKAMPQLFASRLSLTATQAIFEALDGQGQALAASSGFSGGLMNLGRKMYRTAKQAYESADEVIQSLDPRSKATLAGLVQSDAAKNAYAKLRNAVGLGSVPDQVIADGIHLGKSTLAKLFGASGPYGSGIFDIIKTGVGIATQAAPIVSDIYGLGKSVGLLQSGTDAALHGGTDARMYAGTDARMHARSKFHAASGIDEESDFPVVLDDGKLWGNLRLDVSSTPSRSREYSAFRGPHGTAYFDTKLSSLKLEPARTAVDLVHNYQSKYRNKPNIYVTVFDDKSKLADGIVARDLVGRSWEFALANALAGKDSLVTGKIDSVHGTNAQIGKVIGVSSKAQLPGLTVPAANASEAPHARAVSRVSV